MVTKHIYLLVALSAAFLLGLWHLTLAIPAIFVFRNGEPIASWAAVLLGPGSTLLGALVALRWRRLGGYWLVASGLFSFIIFASLVPDASANLRPYLERISGPMVVLGIAIVLLAGGSGDQTRAGELSGEVRRER